MTSIVDEAARKAVENRHALYEGDFIGFGHEADAQDYGFVQGYIAGANRESSDAEAIDRMGPAAGCHLCVGAGGYEDYDGEWRACSCQRADRIEKDAGL